jgi:MFS family permease
MSLAAAPTDSDDPDSSPPAPADRIWTRAFTDLVIAQSLFGFAYAVFLLLPKVLAVAYGASARDIGFVMAAFGVLSLAVIPAVPPVIGRLGRRQTMRASCLLLGASALGFVLVTRAGGPAALLRGLHGVAWSLFFAAGMSLVAEAVPPGRLGQAIGLYGGAALAMNAVAPAVAEPIAAHFGARAVFVLSSAVALGGAWFCHRLPAAVTPAKRPSVDAARAASSGGLLARVLIVLTVGGLAAAGMFTFVAPFSLAHGIAVVRGFFIAYTATALAVRIGVRVSPIASDTSGPRSSAGWGTASPLSRWGSSGPGTSCCSAAPSGSRTGSSSRRSWPSSSRAGGRRPGRACSPSPTGRSTSASSAWGCLEP